MLHTLSLFFLPILFFFPIFFCHFSLLILCIYMRRQKLALFLHFLFCVFSFISAQESSIFLKNPKIAFFRIIDPFSLFFSPTVCEFLFFLLFFHPPITQLFFKLVFFTNLFIFIDTLFY